MLESEITFSYFETNCNNWQNGIYVLNVYGDNAKIVWSGKVVLQ